MLESFTKFIRPTGKHSLAAIALRKGRVIAVGRNSYRKTHPIQAKWAKKVGHAERLFLHAEMDALIKARGRADTIVIVRKNSNGLALAAPCPVCKAALLHAGVKILHS